jgi:hypothetical protein
LHFSLAARPSLSPSQNKETLILLRNLSQRTWAQYYDPHVIVKTRNALSKTKSVAHFCNLRIIVVLFPKIGHWTEIFGINVCVHSLIIWGTGFVRLDPGRLHTVGNVGVSKWTYVFLLPPLHTRIM